MSEDQEMRADVKEIRTAVGQLAVQIAEMKGAYVTRADLDRVTARVDILTAARDRQAGGATWTLMAVNALLVLASLALSAKGKLY